MYPSFCDIIDSPSKQDVYTTQLVTENMDHLQNYYTVQLTNKTGIFHIFTHCICKISYHRNSRLILDFPGILYYFFPQQVFRV